MNKDNFIFLFLIIDVNRLTILLNWLVGFENWFNNSLKLITAWRIYGRREICKAIIEPGRNSSVNSKFILGHLMR
jgi:hypothetical protein